MITVEKILAIASGLALLGVALALVALRDQKHGRWFQAFAGAWGVNVVAQNVQAITPNASWRLLVALVALLASVVATASLLVFASGVHEARRRARRVAEWAVLVGSACLALSIVLVPDAFARIDVLADGTVATRFSLLTSIFVFAPFFGAFAIALVVLVARHDRLGSDSARKESLIMAIALGGYTAYIAGYDGAYYAQALVRGASDPIGNRFLLWVFVAEALTLAVLGLRILRGKALAALTLIWKRRVVLAGVAIAGLGIVTSLVSLRSGSNVALQGLFRIAAVVIIAYGIVKHQVFGVDLKLKWTLDKGALVGGFGVVFFIVDQVAQYFVSDEYGALAGAVAALIMLAFLTPLRKLCHRFAERTLPGVENSPEYLTYRKFAVYRAATEAAARDGVITQDERSMLDRLKQELGLAPTDAASVERDVFAQLAA